MPLSEHLSKLFQQAVEMSDASQRDAFLEENCAGDSDLRSDLEQMLRVHQQASGFLSHSPKAIVAGKEHVGRESVIHRMTRTFEQAGEPIVQSEGDEESNDLHWDAIIEPIGRYQLHGEIARGGMGAILKCRDVDLGRNLAIKVLLESHAGDTAIEQRFIEEAQIGGQLQHPGIAPVYELGTMPDQRPFFSMKLVKGDTLAALLAKRREPEQDRASLLAVFEQVCQTVAYAHSRRVIHRDLKPANIMVGSFGEVQVMDWGLAKVLKVGGIADEKRARDTQLGHSLIQTVRSESHSPQAEIGTKESFGSASADTQAGSVMGTPAYMPPEQALGEVDRLDECCDVFGLGAILCEILTGSPPYVSDDAQDLFRQAARGNLTDCHARLDACGADGRLIEIAKSCLEPEMENRLRNAGELSTRITEYLESVESRLRQAEVQRAAQATKAVEERKRRRVSNALAASVLLLVSMTGAGWMWMQAQVVSQTEAADTRVREHLNNAKLHQQLAKSKNLELRTSELDKARSSVELAQRVIEEESLSKALKEEVAALRTTLQADSRQVQQQIAQQTKDQKLQDRFEFIRLSQSNAGKALRLLSEPGSLHDSSGKQYAEVFREAGIDVEQNSSKEAAELIRASEITQPLISGLDHWTSSLPKTSLSQLYQAAKASGDWQLGIASVRQHLQSNPKDSVAYLNWATMALMSGDKAAYLQACQACLGAFPFPETVAESERTSVVCLLSPAAEVSSQATKLPSEPFEQALDDNLAPVAMRPYLWSTRALLAYRKQEWDRCLRYVNESQTGTPNTAYQAANLSIRAMAEHRMGQHEASRRNLAEASTLLVQLGSEPERVHSNNELYAFLLHQEATQLIDKAGQDQKPLTFATWTAARDKSSDQEVLAKDAFRRKLVDIANLADENPWRKSVRTALVLQESSKLKNLAQAENLHNQPPELVAWFASELRSNDALEESTALLRISYESYPSDFWVNFELGRGLNLQGEDDEALGFARSAVALRPDSAGAKWQLCFALADAGIQDESDELFDRLLSEGEFNDADLEFVGAFLFTHGRFEKAKRVEALHNDAGGEAAAQQALLLSKQKQYNEAIREADKAIAINPNIGKAYYAKADSLRQLGRFEEAEDTYRKQIELATQDGSNGRAPYNNYALVLKAQGKWEEAVEALRQALDQDVNNHAASKNLLMTLREMGKNGKLTPELRRELQELTGQKSSIARTSIEDYRQTLARRPRDTETRLKLVSVLRSLGDQDAALEEAKRAVALDKQNSQASFVLALVYASRQQLDEAIEQLRVAIELQDDQELYYAMLGRILAETATRHKPRIGFGNVQYSMPEIKLDSRQKAIVDEAITQFEKAYELAEKHEKSPLSKGSVFYVLQNLNQLLGRTEEADVWIAKLDEIMNENRVERSRTSQVQSPSKTLTEIIRQTDELRQAGKFNEAMEFVKRHIDENDGTRPNQIGRMIVASIHLDLKQDNKAVEIYNRLIDEFPGEVQGYLGLAKYHAGRDDLKKAEHFYLQGLERTSAQKVPLIRQALANIYFRQGRAEEEIEQLEQVIHPNSHRSLIRQIVTAKFEHSGDLAAATEQARAAYTKTQDGLLEDLLALFLVLQPQEGNKYLHVNEALALAQSAAGDPQRKRALDRSHLRDVYRSKETGHWSFSGANTLGIVHYRRGEYPKALESFQLFDEAGFEEPSNWMFLAMTNKQLGNEVEARRWYDKVLEYLKDNKATRIESIFLDQAKAHFATGTGNR